MAGIQKLHALAQHQLIAHAFAVAVTGIHQSLQEIVAGLLVAALFDVSHQNAVGASSHVFVSAQFSRNCKIWIQVGLKRSMSSSFSRAPNSDRATIAKVIFIRWG